MRLRQDGSEFPVEISLSPLETEGTLVSSAIRDITGRKRTEAIRRQTGALIVDHSDDAIHWEKKTTEVNSITRVGNQGAERLYGYFFPLANRGHWQADFRPLYPARFAIDPEFGEEHYVAAFGGKTGSSRRIGATKKRQRAASLQTVGNRIAY